MHVYCGKWTFEKVYQDTKLTSFAQFLNSFIRSFVHSEMFFEALHVPGILVLDKK